MFEHPKWSRGDFGKFLFFRARGPWWTHRWPPTMSRPGCPLALPSHQWFRGPGVSFCNAKAWKPPKVWGCGWAACSRNRFLRHVAQGSTHSWFLGWLTRITRIVGHFRHFFAPFLDKSWPWRASKDSLTPK